MICSKPTICKSDYKPARANLRHFAAAVALAATLGAAAVQAESASGADAQVAQALVKAKDYLARGDGLAAEIQLKQAQAAGAKPEAIAARMGEALLDQGKRDAARAWLAPSRFAPNEAAHGFRMLAKLEHQDGNLAAAGSAFDQALKITPKDAALWIEIATLRYAGGEHMLAIEAADYALKLDPNNAAALAFRALIVRDQFGLAAALPWFEAALGQDPNNLSVLGDYAATLGDLGRAKDMLTVTRRMLEIDGKNPRAFLLQATLAMRAGNGRLARSLLNRTGDSLDTVPAKLLLDGLIELQSGNNLLAIEAFEKLLSQQPSNQTVAALLAHAYYAAGNYKGVLRFADAATRADASPYLMTVLARAYEMLGARDAAVPLLKRATRSGDQPFIAAPENDPIGSLLSTGRFAEAATIAERRRAASPGSFNTQADAGDAYLALGQGAAAAERYRLAARVRLPDNLLPRYAAALSLAGQRQIGIMQIEARLIQSPNSAATVRMAASIAASQNDWKRCVQLLDYLQSSGSGQDVRLLADLSLAQLRSGDASLAEATASKAYQFQPANAAAATAWGLAMAKDKNRADDARALLNKAQALGGDNVLITEGRKQL